jgi:hypothetical protein
MLLFPYLSIYIVHVIICFLQIAQKEKSVLAQKEKSVLERALLVPSPA